MEPLGTITKYYPFIDEETKSILDSLMDESSSYYDFVQRLCNFVLETEAPKDLVFLAASQAWSCRIEESMRLIQEKFRDVPSIRPWAYYHNSSETDQARHHDAVVKDIIKAIDTTLDDWMEVELHLLHSFFHWPLGDIPSLLKPLEKVKSLIENNSLLKCFESLICAIEGIARFREGAKKEALVIVQRGQEQADANDDSMFKYLNLLEQATILRTINVQDSLARFEKVYELVQDLEVPYLLGEVLNDSAIVFEIAGEYDLAISSHIEKLRVLEMVDVPDHLLPRIYATLGEGQKSLELINQFLEYQGPLEIPTYYIWKSWALALENRLEEAERTLDTAHTLMIKSGSESQLGNYYHASGVVELRKGNFIEALDLFEKAWEIAERIPSGTNQNRALLDLARAEIALSIQSRNNTNVAAPGKWLCKLESFALERNLPGIRMQAALIKSELYQSHDQLKDAQVILVDALDITDSLGVKTLKGKISTRIQEIERQLHDEELVS